MNSGTKAIISAVISVVCILIIIICTIVMFADDEKHTTLIFIWSIFGGLSLICGMLAGYYKNIQTKVQPSSESFDNVLTNNNDTTRQQHNKAWETSKSGSGYENYKFKERDNGSDLEEDEILDYRYNDDVNSQGRIQHRTSIDQEELNKMKNIRAKYDAKIIEKRKNDIDNNTYYEPHMLNPPSPSSLLKY